MTAQLTETTVWTARRVFVVGVFLGASLLLGAAVVAVGLVTAPNPTDGDPNDQSTSDSPGERSPKPDQAPPKDDNVPELDASHGSGHAEHANVPELEPPGGSGRAEPNDAEGTTGTPEATAEPATTGGGEVPVPECSGYRDNMINFSEYDLDHGCRSGCLRACGRLGRRLHFGKSGSAKNPRRALEALRLGCPPPDAGLSRDAWVCAQLGVMLLNGAEGEGAASVEAQPADAVEPLTFACAQKAAVGCSTLAFMTEKGQGGIPRNKSRAIELYSQACFLGHNTACQLAHGRTKKLRGRAAASDFRELACDRVGELCGD